MKSSPDGLIPAKEFLEEGMRPRPSFNDGSNPGMSLCSLFALFRRCSRFLTFVWEMHFILQVHHLEIRYDTLNGMGVEVIRMVS